MELIPLAAALIADPTAAIKTVSSPYQQPIEQKKDFTPYIILGIGILSIGAALYITNKN